MPTPTPIPILTTGATVGQLPCIPIASSVTSYGRDLLFQTKAFVEKHYTIDNGFPANAEVRIVACRFESWRGVACASLVLMASGGVIILLLAVCVDGRLLVWPAPPPSGLDLDAPKSAGFSQLCCVLIGPSPPFPLISGRLGRWCTATPTR
jgi:hypothetical protein